MLTLSRTLAFVLLGLIHLVGQPSAATAATGAVHIQIFKVGFIVGVGSGRGTLTVCGSP